MLTAVDRCSDIKSEVILIMFNKKHMSKKRIIFSRTERIINRAVEKTVSEIHKRTPQICDYFFYGAFWTNPKTLVVWYIFKTDSELECAESSGLCHDIRCLTDNNLTLFGYNQLSKVAFTSIEDINNKCGGDFRLYFQ